MSELRHSPEVEAVIGRPAPWVARRGMLLLGVVVGVLLVAGAFYRYPTTLSGELVLTTVDPPRQLAAPRDMTLGRVLVADRDTVRAGQMLLLASESRARFEHVLALEDQLLLFRGANPVGLLDLAVSNRLLLGPLQDAVNVFQQRQEIYRSLADRRLDGYTSAELTNMIASSERELRQLRQGQAALEDRAARARAEVDREETLAREGLRNAERLAAARATLTAAEEALQERFGTLRSVSLSIELMRNQIEAYRSGQQGSSRQAAGDLSEAFEQLQAAVANWKREFTVVSPVTGVVLLQPEVKDGTYVRQEQLLATVLPSDAGTTVGRVLLPVAGSGRVQEGQEVVVAFDRWPVLEYGSVRGRVTSVGPVPVAGQLSLEVAFPNGLLTSTGGRIEGSPLMQGSAAVIVDRRRLLNRLLSYD